MSYISPSGIIVGRERELAQLQQILDDTITGHGSTVLISGEAGIGKTTLVNDLVREALVRDCLVLTGGSYDLTTTPPYGPWIEVLSDYPANLPDLPPLPAPLRRDSDLAGIDSQQQLFDLTVTFFTDIADVSPLLLVLEDLHWSDAASLELLRYLARQISDVSVMLVASYRDDEITRRDRLFQLLPALVRESVATRLELRPLDRSAIEALIRAGYRLQEVDHVRLLEHLRQMSDGNPLFIRELLHGLEHDGVLIESGKDGWQLGDIPERVVPALLLQVIEGRLSTLEPSALQALGIASVIGTEIPLDLWETVSGLAPATLDTIIADALEARVLAEDSISGNLCFGHALFREALYDGVLRTRRRGYHRQIADTLIAGADPDPDTVAFHFQQAGDPHAVEWLVRAGERAIQRHSWVMAAERFEEAVHILEGVPGSEAERGWLLYRLGLLLRHADQPRSMTALEEASELSRHSGDGLLEALSLMHVGLVHGFVGEYRRGIAEMRAGMEFFDDLNEAERLGEEPHDAESMQRLFPTMNLHRSMLIMWLANTGHLREARDAGNAFLEELAKATEPGQEQLAQSRCADAYVGIGMAHALLGQPEEARRFYAIAEEGYRFRSYDTLLGTVLMNEILLVMLPYYTDRVAERDEMEAGARAAHRRAQGVLGRIVPRHARLEYLDGNWHSARRTAEDQAGAAGQLVMSWRQASMFVLGTILRHQGELDQAWTQVRRLLPLGPATEPDAVGFFLSNMAPLLAANLALDAGDLGTAQAWLDTQDRWLAWSEAVFGKADTALARTRYHLVAKDPVKAREHAGQALELAREPRQPLTLIAVHRLLGKLDRLAGRYGEAGQHLQTSLDIATACRVPYERALILLEQAALSIAASQPGPAGAALEEARKICASLAAQPALDRADELEAKLATARQTNQYPGGLSSREVEVLEHAATGMTNAEIGEALYISPRTVAQHLRSVYNKLGVNSRAAAVARWADLIGSRE